MNDQEIERGLADLKETWRKPGSPPLDEMWAVIDREAFTRPVRTPAPWTRRLLPLAATLVLGFGIGQIAPRLSGGSGPGAGVSPAPLAMASAASEGEPFVGVATDYLERVTALLVTLAGDPGRGQPAGYSATQARDLLTTTRLLMDSPAPMQPNLRALLEDLELVLAQIARLPARPEAPDVYLIDQALDQREVIPRLRVYLAETPTSQP